MILETIRSSADVKKLNAEECRTLASELRSALLRTVSQTGGHLASNLGAVELTIAVHRVFDTGTDRLVFDVGHQCYAHKLLTGRQNAFSTLRKFGGLSGFPKPYECDDDAFIAGHASNSVSVALGLARARTLQNADYDVLALIGDGALTGGLAYEGLNDAGASGEPLIILLNDNDMSINGNVGAVSRYLRKIRTKESYYNFKRWYRGLFGTRGQEHPVYQFSHSVKSGLKNKLYPSSTMFEDMGFTYLGPVDGHDIEQITHTLKWAKELHSPVLIHIKTVKGKGYRPAEKEPNLYHGVSSFDLKAGVSHAGKTDFSAVCGETLLTLAEENERVCAVTAAMKDGTGLSDFAARFPKRFFDVGIAEAHAVSMTAGLAKQGEIPVLAVYSSFLQRGFDQLIHDISLLRLHAVFCIDRAGLVNGDGETHHGLFDVAYLSSVPGMRLLAPASFAELREMLRFAVLEAEGPIAVRYPRGGEASYTANNAGRDFLTLRDGTDGVIVSYGALISEALAASEILAEKGFSAAVIKVNQLAPMPPELATALSAFPRVLFAEEVMRSGSLAERSALALLKLSSAPKVAELNFGDRIPGQGTREELCREVGLTADAIADAMRFLK